MKIDILTLFPKMFNGFLEESILARGQKAGYFEVRLHQLRDWATDAHRTVDDSPYGGGPGMVIKVDVVDRALAELKEMRKQSPHVILLSPQGKRFSQALAQQLTQKHHLILIAGHYEGFDERVRSLVDDEISIGDYVLTGGELPAMVVTDAVVRLLPGVLGKDASSHEESFSELQSPQRLLEYPQYTRPEKYLPASRRDLGKMAVPNILKSGHHAAIIKWRFDQARQRTQQRRPDLLEKTT